ncbi:helix-turn-helix transcriptional regulator [Salinicoccus sp. HZC-1]|uniref:helix-turn-helix transcriptional regulator n=1 Tax=Salinicoccus sp. HZC-1 TaxID=3385497 RepID=UPI00398B1095
MSQSLKERRTAKGLTQSDIAKLIGCSEQYYNMIENEKRIPSVKTAKEIGRVLNVEWVNFFKDKIN